MILGDVQYRTAIIDGSEHSVDIDFVKQENDKDNDYRNKHKFNCPCCGLKMEAVLGDFRAKHFRHYGLHCEPNYYLHSTAEQVFYDEYKHCLDEGLPFIIEVYSEIRCIDNCVANKITCTKRQIKQTIDLTQKYKKITPEKRVIIDGRYYRRPDLLLESEEGEHLWVEMWVTHKTDNDKLKQGSVLELKIASEEKDIAKIRTHKLVQYSPKDDSVRLYLNEECSAPNLGVYSYSEDDLSLNFANLKEISVKPTGAYYKNTKPEWVDLGLPSGTLWSKEYVGSMSLQEAQERYSNSVPTPKQWQELLEICNPVGISLPAGFRGPNGNVLEVFEGDFWANQQLEGNQAVVFHREFLSRYNDSIKPAISGNRFVKANMNLNLCIRLIKKKGL